MATASAARPGFARAMLVSFVAAILLVSLLVAPARVAADQPTEAPPDQQSSQVELTPAQQRVENVIAAASQYLGVAYRVGTEGPATFDCSGLIFRAFSDAGLVDRIGGNRLRAAGYLRWFASRGLLTRDETLALRGDLVIYNNGSHIGLYLGDGRVISALISGVTVHSLHGVSLPVTGFLRPDWSGKGDVAPFEPETTADVPELPAALVTPADWMPQLDPLIPIAREGTERVDMRTPTSRTFENADGTFTTEFHAHPIFYLPAGGEKLQPIDLRFALSRNGRNAVVSQSPARLVARSSNARAGLVSVDSDGQTISLRTSGKTAAPVVPQPTADGRAVDYFDLLPGGVGLRLVARSDGFDAFLVLAKEPDQRQISLILDAPELSLVSNEDGSVSLVDAEGQQRGRIPALTVLDSSDGDGTGGGFRAGPSLSVSPTSDGQSRLTISLKKRLLDETAYPAYIGLSLVDFPAAPAGAQLAFTSSRQADTALGALVRPGTPGLSEMWLGHQPQSHNDNEIYLRFADVAATLGRVDVASASLELLSFVQKADSATSIVRPASGEWDAQSLTWNNQPLAASTPDDQAVRWDSTADGWSAADVSAYVSDVLSRGLPDFGLVLTGDGNRGVTWKRVVAGGGDSEDLGPRLVVTWSGLRPDALVANASDAPAALPTLSWQQPLIAPTSQVRFEVQLSRDNFASIAIDSGTVKGRQGHLSSWTSSALAQSGTYQWRVRVKYAGERAWSPWSTPATLAVVPARAADLLALD